MNNTTLLIVDDSALMIKKVLELLDGSSFIKEVITAQSYDEAINILDTLKPDVALLDINLEGKSGIDILEYIKHNHTTVKTIMFSNQSGEYYRSLCKKSGADHFIDKSKDFNSLPEILRSI